MAKLKQFQILTIFVFFKPLPLTGFHWNLQRLNKVDFGGSVGGYGWWLGPANHRKGFLLGILPKNIANLRTLITNYSKQYTKVCAFCPSKKKKTKKRTKKVASFSAI